ncbi:MAG: DsrE family protein [Candidatus Micrarchaeia archaeon]
MKVIIQVSEKEKIPMGNIVGTHIAILKDVETIEVVFLESAIIAVTNEEMIKPLLEEQKIIVMACRTSMELNHIKESDLVKGVSPTSQGGFIEIIRRQQEGWFYIHV